MEPATAILLMLGGAALASGKKSRIRRPGRDFFGEGEADPGLVAEFITDSARYVSDKYNTMLSLWKFMLPTAYWESRFDPYAQAGSSRNSARGLFQLRADSAFTESNGLAGLRDRPDLLLDPVWNFVAAADYAARGIIKMNKAGYEANLLAIRRYWALPRLVSDIYETEERSRIVRSNFSEALQAVGLSTSTMQEKISLGGYPGIYYIGKDFGLWE